MYCAQRVVDHLRAEHLLLRERPAAPRVRVQRAVLERLRRDLRERRLADPVLGHVALDLHREELRREHQAGLAVPGADPPLLGQRVERARRVLVEADDERDLRAAPEASIACAVVSAEPPVAQPFLTLMNGTPVRPSTDTVVSALPAASEPPAAKSICSQPRPASRERGARGDARPSRGRTRPGGGRTDGCRRRRPRRRRYASSVLRGREGEGQRAVRTGAGISVSSIGIPIRSRAGSDSVSRASTRTSPGSST